MSYKHPDIEDAEYCQKGQHLWVLLKDGKYRICYTCKLRKRIEK